jgi:hypothetical protein
MADEMRVAWTLVGSLLVHRERSRKSGTSGASLRRCRRSCDGLRSPISFPSRTSHAELWSLLTAVPTRVLHPVARVIGLYTNTVYATLVLIRYCSLFLNFLLKQILICYCRPQIFELWNSSTEYRNLESLVKGLSLRNESARQRRCDQAPISSARFSVF